LPPGHPDGPIALKDTVIYTGDDHRISMVTNPGAVNPRQDSVNIPGNKVFNDMKIFENIIEIRDALFAQANNPPGPFPTPIDPLNPGFNDIVEYLSSDALVKIDADVDSLLAQQSFLSARVSMYKLGETLFKSANVRITEDISRVEDVNLGEAAINFTVAQNAYNAALAMGARILPMSLVDFLR
jgi:flagellar hook-associated protein 3 FlgL